MLATACRYRSVVVFRDVKSCQQSSWRWLATTPSKSDPPKRPTLMQRYEQYLEKNWPRAYQMHRMVVDGCKACVVDVKSYYVIRRDLNNGTQKLTDLSRSQLECIIQTKHEFGKLVGIVILAPLPFALYVFALAIIFFPRYVLTRHFWSVDQRREYWGDSMTKVAQNHFVPIIQELPEQKLPAFPLSMENLRSVKVPDVEHLNFNQLFHLSRVHRFFPINGLKNLRWRADALRQLDTVMSKELHCIDRMPIQDLLTHMYIRRLNFAGMTECEMRTTLRSWISKSAAVSSNPCLYLHAPVFTQYKA